LSAAGNERPEQPHPGWTPVEKRLAAHLKPRLPVFAYEFLAFGLKMAWASLYAGLMLVLLIATKLAWRPDWPLARYDALLAAALLIQFLLLRFKLETPREALVVFLYHVVGTLMELFKTAMGSWTYPEPNLFRIGGVPLFTGFMYAAVGSFMVRAIRLFDMRFEPYPPFPVTLALAGAIYLNFFTHHYGPDLRYLLFAGTLLVYGRTMIRFRPADRVFAMPLVLAALLTALFLWIAENIGVWTGTWLYPGAGGWRLVSLAKLGSWYLLLYLSFVLVTLVHRPAGRPAPRGSSQPA
jgi:uncharacterized membrane protein YoaT (DUF817 family)